MTMHTIEHKWTNDRAGADVDEWLCVTCTGIGMAGTVTIHENGGYIECRTASIPSLIKALSELVQEMDIPE